MTDSSTHVAGVVIDGTMNTPALVKRGSEREHVAKWGGSLLYTAPLPAASDEIERYRADYRTQTKCIADQHDEIERLRADADRWRAMRRCFVAVDWFYSDPPMSVAVFTLHAGMAMSGPKGADAIADAARAALEKLKSRAPPEAS